MADAVPAPPAPVTLPIDGSTERFPVRRVLCIGRNYGAHVREMGGDPKSNPPIFFAKFPDTLVPCGSDPAGTRVAYPSATADLHHEIELVVALGGGGAELSPEQAERLVWGYAAGVDLTRRDRQSEAKAGGNPWETAKSFEQCAPIGALRPAAKVGALSPEVAIRLSVNGQPRQSATLGAMIWNVAEVIAAASCFWRLAAGDLIFTGTPEGVGPLVRGDRVEGEVDGVGDIAFTVV